MDILITGATGYVGQRIVTRLIARGDRVTGVVGNSKRITALPPSAVPLVADLSDTSWIARAASEADAAIHTGFTGHGGDWDTAVKTDATLIAALCDALAGTGKTLIVSNGTVFLGDSARARLTEETPVVAGHPAAGRAAATAQARDAAGRGVRGIEVRLASFVYGQGGSVLLPPLIAAADAAGYAFHVDDGSNRTSTLHVEAAADGYLSALDRGTPGGLYHLAGDEEPTLAQIAAAIGIGRGLPVRSVTQDAAEALTDPFTAHFITVDNRIDVAHARRSLGWSPAGYTPLLFDVAAGSYARPIRASAA